MSSRWRQENYFRYARTHFALDALDSYAATPDDPRRLVPNPAKKTAAARVKAASHAVTGAEASRDAKLLELRIVNNLAIEREGNWPIHCAGLMMRTDSVRALGGWAAAPSDEDIVLFAALTEVSARYNDPQVIWLYRQHQGQTTRSQAVRDRSVQGRRIALQRVMAVRQTRLGLDSATPLPGARLDHPDELWKVGPAEKASQAIRPSCGRRATGHG
jgi:hypothetical protein